MVQALAVLYFSNLHYLKKNTTILYTKLTSINAFVWLFLLREVDHSFLV
jgi:hypothetical protein